MKIRLVAIVALLVMMASLCVGCHPASLPGLREIAKQEQDRITKKTEEAIKKSPKFQELHQLCTREIPLPTDFRLVRMYRDHPKETFLGYGYHSNLNYEQIKTFYRDYFLQNGWQLTAQKDRGWGDPYIEFNNDNYRIKIYYFGTGVEVKYSLQCHKLPPSSNRT